MTETLGNGQTPASSFIKALAKVLAGSFSNQPLSPGASIAIVKVFPEAKLFSISAEARDNLFITAVSGAGQHQQSWPQLNLQKRNNSLAGIVAKEQCADLIRCSSSRGETGLVDVDFAASDFQCTAVMAVPIWDVTQGHVSGVLSLGLALGAPSENQKRRLSCMLAVLKALAKALAPILPSQAAYALANLAPFFEPWQEPSLLPCRCTFSPSSPGTGEEGETPGPDPSWRGGSCRDGGSEGPGPSPPQGSALMVGGGASCSRAGPDIDPVLERAGSRRGTSSSGKGLGCAAMHPFFLTFRDGRIEAKFSEWFAADFMWRVDMGSQLFLVGIGVAGVTKMSTEPLRPFLPAICIMFGLLLIRVLLTWLCPRWISKYRDAMLMVFPIIYQFIPISMFISIVPVGSWREAKHLWLIWLSRAIGLHFFLLTTLATMARFRVSFLVHSACALVTLRRIPAICAAQIFDGIRFPVCFSGLTVLLAAVGVAAPHALVWVMERRARRMFTEHHLA